MRPASRCAKPGRVHAARDVCLPVPSRPRPRPAQGTGLGASATWDGYRLLIAKDGGRVRLFSRGGAEWTDGLPGPLKPSGSFRPRLLSWTANYAFATPPADPISLPSTLRCGGTGLTCHEWRFSHSTCCSKTVSIWESVVHRASARFAPALRQPARTLPLPRGNLPRGWTPA